MNELKIRYGNLRVVVILFGFMDITDIIYHNMSSAVLGGTIN